MAVFPNSISEQFCIWMLATPWLEITNPQKVIIAEVQAAAAGSTSVTDNTWNNFLMSTWDHYKAYQAYIDQITAGLGEWIQYGALSTVNGWSVFTQKQIQYQQVGSAVLVSFYLAGTSNSTLANFTIPFTSSMNQRFYHSTILAVNNSVTLTTPGLIQNTNGTSVINLYRNMAAAVWTNANTKVASGQIIIAL